MKSRFKTVIGKQATHGIAFPKEILTDELWGSLPKMESWSPESGAAGASQSFDTSGRASAWLTKLLKKDGWPQPTEWAIYEYPDGSFGVYMILF